MFSFHKPKVYRSPTGCCICRAKSSSSRFTDSKKYEDDFVECFQLEERRNGEICNACVLLVKRWKKLPIGSTRNWRHVVDARAGPGIKSLTKFKSKNKKKPKDNVDKMEKMLKKKHVYLKPDRYREQSPAMSDDLTEEYPVGVDSKGSSREGSPAGSDDTVISDKEPNNESTLTEENSVAVHGWIDLTYFKREMICCGTIFKGPYGEVIVDPSLIKPCLGCAARRRTQRERRANAPDGSPSHSSASTSPAHSVESSSSGSDITFAKPLGKTFSDSSSDSGYDESSNQGIGETTRVGKILETGITSNNNGIEQQTQQQQQQRAIVKIHPIVKSVRTKSVVTISSTESPIKLITTNRIDDSTRKPLSLTVGRNIGTSRQVVATIPSNPLVDFAIHASARREVAN